MIDPKLIGDVIEWQDERFKDATADGAEAHLAREQVELAHAAAEEMADVAFIEIQLLRKRGAKFSETLAKANYLARAAAAFGVDLEAAIIAKLAKNKARAWPDKPDQHGVYSHVKEGTGET